MDALIQWLVHDDQKDLFEFLVALALNLVFLAIFAAYYALNWKWLSEVWPVR